MEGTSFADRGAVGFADLGVLALGWPLAANIEGRYDPGPPQCAVMGPGVGWALSLSEGIGLVALVSSKQTVFEVCMCVFSSPGGLSD